MQKSSERGSPQAGAPGGPRWDTSGLTSSYCNVASATATRNAVALNLGVARSTGRAGTELELLHRIVLAPRVAQQLHAILGRLLAEHDAQRSAQR